MAKLIDIDWDPSAAKLRQFGALACTICAALAFAAWHEAAVFGGGLGAVRAPLSYALAGLAGLCFAFTLLWPRGNRALYLLLTAVAFPIGLVVSQALLLVLFFLVITPIALVLRGLGKDPLSRAPDPAAASYWQVIERERPKSDYFRQF